jgi:D-beta-D-heptose 7-phosphate kinase/D-beta-D-heptose 1-phosphate adenosyltransferase
MTAVGVVLSSGNAAAWADEWRARGLKIVFTNGVFDLLHPGHVRYLAAARRLGDVLIVGVNSDRSTRALEKGHDRPLNRDAERAEVLAALASVDAAVIFDEDTPQAIVMALQPDVLVKGADWAEGTIVGADIVEARGGQVVRIPIAKGYSTSRLVERIRSGTRAPER